MPAMDDHDAHHSYIIPDGWEYPDAVCMECGGICDRWEEVDTGFGGPWELWCYCPRCKVETFHPRQPVANKT